MKKISVLNTLTALVIFILFLSVYSFNEEPEARINLALNKTTCASDTGWVSEAEGYGLKYLTDGFKMVKTNSQGAYWVSAWASEYSSNVNVEKWFMTDLNNEYIIDGVSIYPRGTDGKFFPEDYEVQVSCDAVNWSTVAKITSDTSTAIEGRTINFSAVKARYVRIYVTKLFRTAAGKGYVMQISELEVFEHKTKNEFIQHKPEIWLTIGESDKVTGSFKYEPEKEVKFTYILAENGDEIIDFNYSDGSFTAKKLGVTTVYVTENITGKTYTYVIKVIEKAKDNIIISIPVWRDTQLTEEQFKLLKDAEIDVIVKHHNLDTKNAIDDTGIEDVLKMCDLAKSSWTYGRRALRISMLTGELENVLVNSSDEDIIKFAEKYKNLPALFGYHIKDEPLNANPYARLVRILSKADPDSIPNINFLPGGVYGSYGEYYDKVSDYAMLLGEAGSNTYLSFDNYPFPWNPGTVDENSLFSNFEVFRKIGLKQNIKTAFYVQGIGYKDAYRRPDEGQLRYHISAAMAYGFKVIQYYTWYVSDSRPDDSAVYTDAIMDKSGNPTELYYVAQTIHKELHNIGETLVKLDAVNVYHTGSKSTDKSYITVNDDFFIQPIDDAYSILSLMVHKETGKNYLMIVNKDFSNDRTLSFNLANITHLKELDKSNENGNTKEIELTDGILTRDFKAGEFVLYELDGNYTAKQEVTKNLLDNTKIYASDSEGTNGWYINKINDGICLSETDSKGWKVSGKAGTNQWLIFDLGSNKKFNRIDIYPAGMKSSSGSVFPNAFQIYASNDMKNWSLILDEKNIVKPKFHVPYYTFEETEARYIKFVIPELTIFGFEIAELALYLDDGTIPQAKTGFVVPELTPNVNIAKDKSAYSSDIGWTSDAEGLGIKYLTDGYKMVKTDANGNHWLSSWPSEYSDTQDADKWFLVDLGNVYCINTVNLYPRGSDGKFFPEDYKIQVSTDGINYLTVVDVKGDIDNEIKGRTYLFNTVEARYVRVFITKLYRVSASKGFVAQVSEIEVLFDSTVYAVETEGYTSDKWTNENIKFNFICNNPNLSPTFHYSIDDGEIKSLNSSLIIDKDMDAIIKFFVSSQGESMVYIAEYKVMIDKSSPLNASIDVDNSVASFSADFGLSGRKSMQYQLILEGQSYDENGIWHDTNDSIVFTEPFKGKLYVRFTDNAGNSTIVFEDIDIQEDLNPKTSDSNMFIFTLIVLLFTFEFFFKRRRLKVN